jgi:D-ribose pyranase
MKKGGILNKDLNALIGSLGHGDHIVISDAGLAIPRDVPRIELALEKDSPTVLRVLELLREELIIEKYSLASEMTEVNPVAYAKYRNVYAGTTIQEVLVPHEQLAHELVKSAKAVVRTGSFSPYGSIVLYPAIDAPEWYKAEGVQVPKFYQDRVKK